MNQTAADTEGTDHEPVAGTVARPGELIPWLHGEGRRAVCFGDDMELRVDPGGRYRVISTRDAALERFVGCRISVERRRAPQTLVGLLRYVDDLLTRHAIAYWANSGTLLGAMREGDVVPWDNDADLMIRNEDMDRVAALRGEVEAAGHVFTENSTFGRGYKMYVKSAETPKIMVELCSMYRHPVTLEDGRSTGVWTYHPEMVKRVGARVERMHAADPDNEIGAHRFRQRQASDILIDNQYLDEEIFPIRRIPYQGFSLCVPAQADVVLHRDYGPTGLLHGIVSCACQWTEGDYLLKVAVEPQGAGTRT